MMKKPLRILALAAMCGVVAACGDDDPITGNDTSALTEGEVDELANVIFQEAFLTSFTAGFAPQATDGPQMVVETVEFDNTRSCPLGGDVAASGTIVSDTDEQTGAGTVTFDVGLVHGACQVQSDQGTQFTLTGSPGIDFVMEASTDGQDLGSIDGSITGAVAWATGDREGTCATDITFSGESTATSFSFSISGSTCGTSVSSSVSVTTG